jgi:hypothetical protein
LHYACVSLDSQFLQIFLSFFQNNADILQIVGLKGCYSEGVCFFVYMLWNHFQSLILQSIVEFCNKKVPSRLCSPDTLFDKWCIWTSAVRQLVSGKARETTGGPWLHDTSTKEMVMNYYPIILCTDIHASI